MSIVDVVISELVIDTAIGLATPLATSSGYDRWQKIFKREEHRPGLYSWIYGVAIGAATIGYIGGINHLISQQTPEFHPEVFIGLAATNSLDFFYNAYKRSRMD